MIIAIRLSPPKMVDVKMRHSGIFRYRSPDEISLCSEFLCSQSSQVPTKASGSTANRLKSLLHHLFVVPIIAILMIFAAVTK